MLKNDGSSDVSKPSPNTFQSSIGLPDQGLETESRSGRPSWGILTPTVQPRVKVVWKQRSKTRLASLNNGWSPLSGSTMAKRSCAMMVLPWAPKCRCDHHVSRLSIASAHPLTHHLSTLSSTKRWKFQTKMSITRIYISRISHWLPVVPKAKMISETLRDTGILDTDTAHFDSWNPSHEQRFFPWASQ